MDPEEAMILAYLDMIGTDSLTMGTVGKSPDPPHTAPPSPDGSSQRTAFPSPGSSPPRTPPT